MFIGSLWNVRAMRKKLESSRGKSINLLFFGTTHREERTLEELRQHYEVERELANTLRNATREERRHLYSVLYDELFRRVPLHPQLTARKDSKLRLLVVSKQMNLLRRFLTLKSTFLEVGPGDCRLSLELSKYVSRVYAIDVSEEITKNQITPENFELIISDGSSIPVPGGVVTVAYSKDLMEHLHPEDAVDQLRNIFGALASGGKYICITPNRLSGPHDISRFFDDVATGFHLNEYTATELSQLFRKVGFSRISTYIGGEGIFIRFPLFTIKMLEKLLSMPPSGFRRKISIMLPVKAILGIVMVGTKGT
jgi:SAM-dependent methyltransferase